MRIFIILAVLAAVLSSCDQGNLGFYVYPQAAVATGVSEEPAAGPLAGLEVVGYLPAYKIPIIDPAQARHLTDLVYFTLTPRADGTLNCDVLVPSHVDFLRKIKKEYGTRIILGIADHNRKGPLSTVVRSPVLRERFATKLTNLLAAEGFDGADFNWEFPSDDDLPAYALFLDEVHRDFAPLGLRLSAAVSPTNPLTRAGYRALDRVHGMLYDDWGEHSTLENSSAHVQEMIDQGVPPSKLLMGVPFYGRGYTRKGPSWSNALSYKSLKEKYSLSPDQDKVSGYYFNGIDTIRRKVQFAKSAGLSGVMVWEIGQDTNDSSSLLGAITEARKDLARLN